MTMVFFFVSRRNFKTLYNCFTNIPYVDIYPVYMGLPTKERPYIIAIGIYFTDLPLESIKTIGICVLAYFFFHAVAVHLYASPPPINTSIIIIAKQL